MSDGTSSVHSGCGWWRPCPVVPCGWPVLLPVPTRDIIPCVGGSHPRRPLHRLHAWILRFLLQDLD